MASLYPFPFARLSLVLCAAFALASGMLSAADGDTVRVRTVEFTDRGPKQAGTYTFPSAPGNSYRKVLMNYTLKCPDGKPCGEWDYLMYVYLYHPSGRMDSTLMPGPNFTVNGGTTASFSYFGNAQGWRYSPRFERRRVIDQTKREGWKNKNGQTIDTIGSLLSGVESPRPLNTSAPGSKSQYLWRASELTAANLLAGDITAMHLYVQKTGSNVQRLTVRVRNTSLGELSAASVEQGGFTTVIDRNMAITTTGTFVLPFTYPFAWDGTSNLIVEIAQNNVVAGQNIFIGAVPTAFPSALEQNTPVEGNYYAQFDGQDYITTGGKAAIKTGTVEARFMAADTNGQHYILSNDRDAGEDFAGYHLYLNGGKLYGSIWRESDNKIMTVSGGKITPGQWYHSAMTFDGTTLSLYVDGEEVAKSTTAPTTIKDPAYNLMIGVLAFEAPNYYRHNGGISDVRVWNTPLSAATIRAWRFQPGALSAHPNYSSLIAWYPLNGKEGLRVRDMRGTADGAFMAGKGNWRRFAGAEYFTDVVAASLRPWTQFEQGDYVSHIDSVLVVDSVLANPVTLIRYTDFSKPGKATDTLVRWGSYYRYSYDSKGKVTDSVLVTGDQTIALQYHPYYSEPFEVIERYELMRYITPYGNGLNLGNGFTWTMDITDYAPLLKGDVKIEAYNPQEALELTFDMIKGTPVREVVDITPLWDGNVRFGGDPTIESFLVPKTHAFPAETKGAKLRVIQTGHGFGGSEENCAEFCDKVHFVKVDGTQRYERHVWRNTCGLNPVYPQGGTWVYNRSNWCPGAEVTPFDYELTPYIASGKSSVIDVDMEPYTYTGNPGNWPNYVFTGTLFTYGAIKAARDVSIEHIIRPSNDQLYSRQNPICARPQIVIRNNGSQPLTSLTIEYGVRGGGKTSFAWSGTIPPLEERTIDLLQYNDWNKATDEHLFEVWLINPNGGEDEYPIDNYSFSHFEPVPEYFNEFEVRLRTNKFAADQYEWTLKNAAGDVIVSHSNLADNTAYVDSLQLPDGCYEFRLINKLGYGLDFWAMRSQLGSGSLSFSSLGKTIKSFGGDFGSEIYHQFTVAMKPSVVTSSDTVKFGDVLIDTEKQMTVEISPANSKGLTIKSVSLATQLKKVFNIVSVVPDIPTDEVELAPGEKMVITLSYKPTKNEMNAATLRVVSNDLRTPTLSIPLRGTGQLQVSVGEKDARSQLYLFAAPNAFSDESTVSFSVDTPTPTPAKITVVNSIGGEVAVLHDGLASGDVQTVALSAKTLPAGVYYIVLHAAGATTAVPVTIVK